MEVAMRLPALLLALTLADGVHTVGAQTPPRAGAPGTRVFVTPSSGGPKVEGSLLSLSADSVALLVGGNAQIMPLGSVKRIEREGDRNIDGAVIGALLVGVRCARVCGQGLSTGDGVAGAVLVNAALGALIGWWVDRNHVGRTQIYPVLPDRRDTHPRR